MKHSHINNMSLEKQFVKIVPDSKPDPEGLLMIHSLWTCSRIENNRTV